jgi:hypothetical protein
MPITIYADQASSEKVSSAQNLERLTQLSDQAQVPLYSCSGKFPYTLFPDTVDVYIDKVIITYKRFFFSKEIFPVIIKDLLSVSVSTNLFFGTVKFDLTLSPSDPDPISFLPKEGALKIHQLTTGLLVAQKNGIELRDLSHEEVYTQIEQIGSAATKKAT